VAGETLDYDVLADAVLGEEVCYRPYCRTPRLSKAFVTLAVALTADRDLTLVDHDLTQRELGELLLDAERLERNERIINPCPARSLEAWVEHVRVRSGSRITLFTSGSTGLPKGVSHSLATLSRGVRTGPKHADDVWGYAYNPTHMAGVQVFLQALFNLNPLVNLFRLSREQVLALLGRHQVTHLSATPSFYRLLLPADTVLSEVRAVTMGGERADALLLERLRPLFPNARFRNVYASTEAGTLFSAEGDVFSVPEELKERIWIREGRLHVHRGLLGTFTASVGGASQGGGAAECGGASVPASRDVIPARQEPRPTEGDWYDTGDVVEVVSESPLRFRIVGRDRDWINVGGNKVNPAEVEAVLLQHPGVREARVFGRANAVLGKVLCADVVSAGPPVGEPELRQFLGGRLQAFKVPRLIRLVKSVELGRTGKLVRGDA